MSILPNHTMEGLNEAIRFLASIFNQDRTEISRNADEVRHIPDSIMILDDISKNDLISAKTGRRFETVAAIDGGSSSLLTSGNFGIGVCKASLTVFRNSKREFVEVSPEWIIPAGEGLSSPIIDAFCKANNIKCSSPSHWNSLLDQYRQLLEYAQLRSIVYSDITPDLIMLDGALGCPPGVDEREYIDLLTDLHRKHTIVVGVSKSSALRWGNNYPLVSRVAQMAKDKPAGDIWFISVSKLRQGYSVSSDIPLILLGNLFQGSGPILRLDIQSIYEEIMEDIVCALADYARDPEFPGYPFPLAEAHRLARITPSRKLELGALIRASAAEVGVDLQAFDAAFDDYHRILNEDIRSEMLSYQKPCGIN